MTLRADVDRVRRLATALWERHRDQFTTDFEQNKATLGRISVIRSKQLRNELAGYMTALARKETAEPEAVTEAPTIVAAAASP
jgi:small subunit ribosomal protein S17e